MEETASLTNAIVQTINNIFQTLFSSIDNSVYQILDELTFINPNILNEPLLEKLFGTSASNGLLLLANSLLFGFALYYGIRLIYSYYMNLLSESIRSIGASIIGHEISFSELINKLNSVISIGETDFNIFSFDGLIKSFISVGLFNLIFSWCYLK